MVTAIGIPQLTPASWSFIHKTDPSSPSKMTLLSPSSLVSALDSRRLLRVRLCPHEALAASGLGSSHQLNYGILP